MSNVGDLSDEEAGVDSSCHLEVARKDLVRALRILAEARRGLAAAEAVLTYSDGQLEVEFPMASASIPARGRWEGAVRVPPPFAVKLVRIVPPPDPLHIYIKGTRLHFASLSVELEPGGAAAGAPSHHSTPSFKELLLFGRAQSSPEQLKALQEFREFAEAEQKANNLFNAAAKLLGSFGVTNADLSRLIWECLERDPAKAETP